MIVYKSDKKKILIVVSGNSRNKYILDYMLGVISNGFGKFNKYEISIKRSANKKIDTAEFDIIIFMFWKFSVENLNELLMLQKLNKQLIFFSDGLVRKRKKTISDYSKYYGLVFTRGPQSAYFCNRNYDKTLPNNRLSLFGNTFKLSPWRKNGNKVVISHQFGYSYDLVYKPDVYRKIITNIKEQGYYTIFRMHPACNNPKRKTTAINDCFGNLCDEIEMGSDSINYNDIYASISYGGKVGSKFVICGIPTFTIEDTIASPMVGRGYNIGHRVTPDRDWWVNWLSYRHWTLKEFDNGDCLDFLYKHKELYP